MNNQVRCPYCLGNESEEYAKSGKHICGVVTDPNHEYVSISVKLDFMKDAKLPSQQSKPSKPRVFMPEDPSEANLCDSCQ